jgi:hypothetical protein
MSKIKLRPGDYVMAEDVDSEEMHNELREAFRAAGCLVLDDRANYQFREIFECIAWGERFLLWVESYANICLRRVYPDQILGKDEMMLIEALKPGMQAKILTGIVYHNDDGKIVWRDTGNPCNVAVLMQTEYEIIKDGPWEPSDGDLGYWVSQFTGDVVKSEGGKVSIALRTKEAAEQMAKIQKVYTALMNMPGAFEGESCHVYFSSRRTRFDHMAESPDSIFDVPFDTYDHMVNAEKYANNLLSEME